MSTEPHLPNLWIADEGPDRDVVVSSRMRLARNVCGYAFKTRQRTEEDGRLSDYLRGVLLGVEPQLTWLSLDELPDVMRQVLFERHVVSREHVADEHERGVAFNTDATTSVLVNEEDHLRMQVFTCGLDLERLDDRVNALDDRIGEHVEYCFDPRFGYLTSCPTNAGTGLRVSVMLHLPALSLPLEQEDGQSERLIGQAARLAQKMGLTIRGMHGESSRAEGDFYQISNQVTLGKTADQAIGDVRDYVPQVVEHERHTRGILLDERRHRVEDKVWRAWAVLGNARMMSSSEALAHLSWVRLGVVAGLIDAVTLGMLHTLMVRIRPGHLQHAAQRELTTEERDMFRADLIRDTLKSD